MSDERRTRPPEGPWVVMREWFFDIAYDAGRIAWGLLLLLAGLLVLPVAIPVGMVMHGLDWWTDRKSRGQRP